MKNPKQRKQLANSSNDSLKRLELRRSRCPVPAFDDALPINQHREEIARLIENNQVVIVCGETGSGKTYPVLRICDQLLGIPREDRDFNLLIIQALKRDADFLIKRHNNLKVIEWKDFRRAMLQVENWDTPIDKINSFCGVFSTVNWLMLHSQPLFKRAVVRCCEKNKVFDGSELYPIFSELFKEIDGAAKDFDLDGYEHRNVRDHIKFVVSSIIETNEILDCRCGLTVQDFFSQEDVILNVMGEDNDYIIGTIVADILSDLRRFYEKSPLHPPKLRTLIVVDECRRIFPTGSEDNKSVHKSNSKMERFVTTRRSSGIGLIAITQEPQSSPDWLTNNSAYVLSFPIGGTGRK